MQCQDLVLIPTEFEREHLTHSPLDFSRTKVAICGFGPIAAAANTARLLALVRPKRVLLVGIAGSYTSELCIGSACVFTEVACYGIGAGNGSLYQTDRELGWETATPAANGRTDPTNSSGVLTLCGSDRTSRLLLTVCSASATDPEVQWKLQKFAKAEAEDMEGYGVALACAQFSVPLHIIRGISNNAGDRDHSRWRVRQALLSAAELAQNWLSGD